MIEFTPEQEEFRRAVARFVDAEVVPAAEAIDARAEFPWTLFKRIGELGYLGLRYPEAYGGAGADMVTYCLFAEELARGSLSVAAAAAMQSLMGTYFIYAHGSEALRRKYLVPALRGDLVATFALTEPNAGSDVANILARAAYGAALAYARERVAFGKPIVEHQAIGFKLADMVTQLHAATLMTYQAAARLDARRAITREAAMVKLFASEMAVTVTDEAVRIFASYGLAMEYPVQRYFRDARFLLPGGGTSEILRVVIGRDLDWDRSQAFA